MTGSADTRELAAFLRARRERLDPSDFGLGSRRPARRTPGLRREEVAELAGVSVDYVVRLEQARGLRPSVGVLESLATALRLSEDEREYLFDLTRQRPVADRKAASTPTPSLVRLVDDLAPLPVMLLNHRFDILAWNGPMARLLLDFGALPPTQRNSMWLCVAHPEVSAYYPDREATLRDAVAHLRTARAAHADDDVLADLIRELEQDGEFARVWRKGDVRVMGRGVKTIRHPVVGDVRVEFETLTPLQDPDQLLAIHRAADPASQAALDRLLST